MLNDTPSRGQTLGCIATELFSIDLIRPFQVGNLGIISHSPYCSLRKFHEKEKFKSLHILNTLFDNSSNLLYVFVFKCYPFSLKLMMTSSEQ